MPVDPDILQSTAGGGYHPGLDPDYDPDQVSSRPSAGAEPRPKPESDLKFKKQQQKEEKFNPTEDSPVDPSNKNSDGSYRSAMARESREADKKTEQKRQASKKLASKDSSAQDGGSHRPGGGQKALEQVGQSKGFTNSLPGGGGGKPGMPGMPGGAGATGAKGAGGGKAAAAEAAVQGLQKGLQKVQQGDIKGGAEDAAIGAIEGAGSAAASAAFKYLASPPAIAATFTLSIFIGWNLLLIAPRVLKGILKTFTKKEIDIKLETWQRYVIIAMDVLIAFIIFLCFVVATAAFCYSLTSPTLKDRLYSFAASPAGASAGELGRFFMPQSVVDFCGKLTGNVATTTTETASGEIHGSGGSGGARCQPANPPSPATIENLSSSCFAQYGPDVVRQASIVAQSESNGNPSLPVGARSCGKGKPLARCVGGEIPVWGLYQINLIVHKVDGLDCPSAFRTTSGGRHDGSFCNAGNQCVVVDQTLYNKCAKAAVIAEKNIKVACELYRISIAANRSGWWDWGNIHNEHGKRCGF